MNLRRLCPTLLITGILLMIPFETPITLILGVGCLLGFVVTGWFLIATPEYLSPEGEDTSTASRDS